MKRNIKVALIALLLIVAATVIVAATYMAYVFLSYSRLPEKMELEVMNQSEKTVEVGKEYTALTYNIGYGSLSDDYSFFLDEADWKDGTHTVGKYGKGLSRNSIIENIEGEAAVLREVLPDFILLQEVDEDATRSYHINEAEYFMATFPYMNATYAENFHSPWLNLPLTDPHGIVNAGLLTLSRFRINYAERRSYPIADDFSKLFDLDRCFSVQRFPVEGGKTLVLVNSHMSAYDEGGVIRKLQLELLTSFMEEEYAKGNWVIIGGDFNHSLGEEFVEAFKTEQLVPGWANVLDNKDLPEHFSIVKPENGLEVASCRNLDTPYQKDVTYTTILDGFIVSDNIKAESVIIDTDFRWSDHQPVVMTFTLL